MNKEEETSNIGILIPCFNENVTILYLLDIIRKVLPKTNFLFRIIVVDDGSTDNTLQLLLDYKVNKNLQYLDILSLEFNHGHQKAIYQGVLYACEMNIDNLIIMDGDGEDNPEIIVEIIKYTTYDVLFVKRGRRRNNICFLLLYYLYRAIFFIITSRKLRIGNFCMINKKTIDNIAQTGFIHLGAKLLKLKCNTKYIAYNKSKRLGGKSKMSFSKLVIHAIHSFAEFAEEMIYIILILTVIFSLLFLSW